MKVLRWSDVSRRGWAAHYGRRVLRPGESVRAHGHDFAEVFWVLHGQGRHDCNGQAMPLMADRVIVVCPGDRHAIHAVGGGEGLALVNVAFPQDVLKGLADRYPGGSVTLWDGGPSQRVFRVRSGWRDVLMELMDAVADAPSDRGVRDRLVLCLGLALERCADAGEGAALPEWLRGACRSMEQPENLAGGAARLAALAGRSPEHVARVLRAATGRTPIGLVTELRMRHAATRLRGTEDKILMIAMDCGYDSLSHFYRVFRAHHGVTPRAYRLGAHRALPLGR